MQARAYLAAGLICACAILLAACGGGGGSNSTPLPATPPNVDALSSAQPSASPRAGVTPSPTPSPALSATPMPVATLAPISTGPGGVGWAPYAIAHAFAYPVQSGFNGAGVTMAVINDYPPQGGDLSTFFAQFGITRSGTLQVKNIDGGSSQNDQSGQLESTLDVETMGALAPGANIIYYATPDLSAQSLLDAYNSVLSDGAAQVVDLSYGGCEASVERSGDNALFAQAAAQGIAFVAAAGDWGDECFDVLGNHFGVNYPASDPNVIGVGGTETAANSCGNGTIASQVAFNDRCRTGGAQEATGGGVSSMFTLPSYQAGLGASVAYRNVPDVAMPAAGAATYLNGSWTLISGTSWGAPQIAAMVAELYQYCNGPLTPPIDLFYNAYHAAHYDDFIAVTTGNNEYGSDPTYFAANGDFSDVSGIGEPLGMRVALSVCPNRTPASSARAMRGTVALTRAGAAQPTQLENVPNVRALRDLGRRSDDAQTRIVVVLRATSTVAESEQAAISSLTSAGFSILSTYSNHLVIDAQAPGSVVASYFQTEIHDFAQGRYGTRYANVDPDVVPAAIAPYVQSVVTQNLITAIPMNR